MAQQTMTGLPGLARASAGGAAAPEVAVRLVGALLALAVAAAHVADQGGVTAFTSPDWIGWGYRLIEVVGVFTALALLLPWPGQARAARAAVGGRRAPGRRAVHRLHCLAHGGRAG